MENLINKFVKKRKYRVTYLKLNEEGEAFKTFPSLKDARTHASDVRRQGNFKSLTNNKRITLPI